MFPNTISAGPAPGVEGDFCDSNPRSTVNAGPGGLVAGASCIIARFGWATPPVDFDGAPAVVNSFGAGPVTGFLHREMQGLNTVFLQEYGMQVLPGLAVTLFKSGGFWVKNRGSTEALPGQFAYANFADGSAYSVRPVRAIRPASPALSLPRRPRSQGRSREAF